MGSGDVAANLIFIALVVGVIVYVIRGFWKRLDNRRTRGIQDPADIRPTNQPSPKTDSATHAPGQHKPRVFLCYRRADSSDVTGRIYDRLIAAFGSDAVFKDVDDIPLGVDFRSHIHAALSQTNVFLVIIGPRWADTNADGTVRISAPGDHVRVEIAFALQTNIPLIPVLVSGARMPTEQELPRDIGLLIYRNAVPIRPDPDFNNDMDRLVRGIKGIPEKGTA
jgi:hypothetical protein